MMDTLQELYDHEIQSNNETIILLEDIKEAPCKRFIIYLQGKARDEIQFPKSICKVSYTIGSIEPEENIIKSIERTKIIYITNTLNQLDDERYRRMYERYWRMRYNAEKHHIRNEFIYNCSLCGTIRQDVDSDCVPDRDLLSGFFINEYYKQVKCAFDSTQYENLITIREKGVDVPIPKKLSITMHKVPNIKSKTFELPRCLNNDNTSEQIAYRLCALCFTTFIRNTAIDTQVLENLFAEDIPKNATSDAFIKLFDKVKPLIKPTFYVEDEYDLHEKNCKEFINYVCKYMDKLNRFDISNKAVADMMRGESVTLLLSIGKNDEEVNKWFIGFMEHYCLTCTPHYYLDFSWGLSSGENNLLRFFSTLFSTFRYSNSKIYNERMQRNTDIMSSMDRHDGEQKKTFHRLSHRILRTISS